MSLISDILLMAAAAGAGFYCLILSRRLKQFANLESGMGGAISALSEQVSELTATLEQARAAADSTADGLRESTEKAEAAARRIEFLLASMHDLPEQPARTASVDAAPAFSHRAR